MHRALARAQRTPRDAATARRRRRPPSAACQPGTFARCPDAVLRFRPLLVLTAAALAGLAGCARDTADGLPEGVAPEDLPESESWNARLRVSQDGVPVLQIAAPYLARHTDGDSATIRLGPAPGDSGRVTLRLFDSDGGPRATLRAGQMRYDETTERVRARDAVEADLPGVASIRAPALSSTADGAFTASGGATVELLGATPGTVRAPTITADSLGGFAATGGANVDLRGDTPASVQAQSIRGRADGGFTASGAARVSLRGARPATIAAPTVSARPGGAFTASGGARVTLSDPSATITARTVSGTSSRYTADGGARVETSGGRTLTAARVVWDAGAERFRAPGAFRFVGPGEDVRGTDLVATADLSRYSFRRASGQIEVEE